MNKRILPSGEGLRSVVVLAMAAPLVYCVGIVYFFEGRLPWPGPWLVLVALTGAIVGLAATSFLTGGVASRVSSYAELVVRYSLALLLFQFALNKLIPGQFLLYNRDLDLSLRELPARRLAWHFLGYSQLYNAFVASVGRAAQKVDQSPLEK